MWRSPSTNGTNLPRVCRGRLIPYFYAGVVNHNKVRLGNGKGRQPAKKSRYIPRVWLAVRGGGLIVEMLFCFLRFSWHQERRDRASPWWPATDTREWCGCSPSSMRSLFCAALPPSREKLRCSLSQQGKGYEWHCLPPRPAVDHRSRLTSGEVTISFSYFVQVAFRCV